MRENVDSYFLLALNDKTPTRQSYECRLFAAFVISTVVYKFDQGQGKALTGQLLSTCLEQIANDAKDSTLRKWFVICLGNLWYRNENVRWAGARDLAYEKLFKLLKDPDPEVRAATVYALGTFISSTLDRTSQANDLDRQIAMHMLDSVSNDMSPLVRAEIVCALQWIIKLFDTQFVEIVQRDEYQSNGSLAEFSVVKDGSWKRINNLKPVASEKSLQYIGMDRSSFGHSLGSSVYTKIWNATLSLARDPYPQVSKSGNLLLDYIKQMVVESNVIPGREVICDRNSPCSSSSLPPSPLTKNLNQFMSNSHSGSTVKLNESTNSAIKKSDSTHKLRVPIVKTSFIEWEIGSMSKPMKELKNNSQNTIKDDQFSFETLDRRKRFIRNEKIRQEGLHQQRAAIFQNLKSQTFIARTVMTPTIVKLHPYEEQIAVAYSDRLFLNEWTAGSQVQNCFSPIQIPSTFKSTFATTTNSGRKLSMTTSHYTLRLSSIQFINAHVRGLVMAGYDDGSIRIWRNPETKTDDKGWTDNLLTAFQALDDQSRSSGYFGLQTAWHQSTQTIFVGGESKYLRLWDAERELKICDISTGSNCSVSHLCCSPNALYAIALTDGSINIYDRRLSSNESKIMSYKETDKQLLTICLKNDCESLISGG